MRTLLSLASFTSLLIATGCVATTDSNESAGGDSQEARFPEDGPGESCKLRVPLECPSDGAATISKDGTQISCKTLGSSAPIRARQRPDDVIAVDGSSFVRGYDLEGNALSRACYELARKQCTVLGPNDFFCQDEQAEQCIAAFALPDPCEFDRDPTDPR